MSDRQPRLSFSILKTTINLNSIIIIVGWVEWYNQGHLGQQFVGFRLITWVYLANETQLMASKLINLGSNPTYALRLLMGLGILDGGSYAPGSHCGQIPIC